MSIAVQRLLGGLHALNAEEENHGKALAKKQKKIDSVPGMYDDSWGLPERNGL